MDNIFRNIPNVDKQSYVDKYCWLKIKIQLIFNYLSFSEVPKDFEPNNVIIKVQYNSSTSTLKYRRQCQKSFEKYLRDLELHSKKDKR